MMGTRLTSDSFFQFVAIEILPFFVFKYFLDCKKGTVVRCSCRGLSLILLVITTKWNRAEDMK